MGRVHHLGPGPARVADTTHRPADSAGQTVAAEAKKFNDLLPRYQADPDLFRQRLLTETAGRILTNAQFKAFVPVPANGRPWELRLQLAKEPEITRKETATP